MARAGVMILVLLMAFSSRAQHVMKKKAPKMRHTGVVAAPPEVITYISVNPEFYGGKAELDKYLDKMLRYPEMAREAGVQGKVIIRFFIDEEGNITEPKVVKGIGAGCDQEAIRVVKAMPAWRPGIIKNKKCKMVFFLPVVFKIV